MAAPNIVNVSTITGKTTPFSVTTTTSDLVANPGSSGKVFKVNTVIVGNINGNTAADVSLEFYRSATSYFIAKTVAVPADASLVILSRENAIYLEEGDNLRITASANSYLQAVCSYEEIS